MGVCLRLAVFLCAKKTGFPQLRKYESPMNWCPGTGHPSQAGNCFQLNLKIPHGISIAVQVSRPQNLCANRVGVRMNRRFPGSGVPYPIDKAPRTQSSSVDDSADWDAKWLKPNVTSMRARAKDTAEPRKDRPASRPAQLKVSPETEKPKLSMTMRFLRWLFPDVNQRRAKRYATPGLVAYYWTGGAPYSYHVGDMSATGLFLLTKERWAPGTLIQMTLQKQDGKTSNPEDAICVLSEVVRWGENGSGFNFVLSDYEDIREYGVPTGSVTDRKTVERFMHKIGVPHS